jgi:calcineurin-like phosphoesterase family protein
MNFYIADTHFFHENIIMFDDRPFKDVQEMNEALVSNWNSAVSKEDVVYILGDYTWRFHDEAIALLKTLNGRKRITLGNHDKSHDKKFKNLFEDISHYDKIDDNGKHVILSHYPIIAYDGSYKGRNIMLHGHTHLTHEAQMIKDFIRQNKCEEYPMRIYNVGAMMPYMDYTPRTLEYILSKCE